MTTARVHVLGMTSEVTFERPGGGHAVIVMATIAAGWLASLDLLDLFGAVVVAATPEDRHDPTYVERAQAFLSMYHAPASILATFET